MIPTPNSPLLVRGDLRLVDPETGGVIAEETRVALCRCGKSGEPAILRQLPPPHPFHRRIPHRKQRTRRCEVASRHLPAQNFALE
jgi:hypothetical protein